ncbi:GPW/gp25 family protein [Shinella sp. JR1-6]|uniref:GPW/gp25 family protein n=1 Tax=Shinella sp. JR1-6 TaxID=2527671 RepID=UPI00102D5F01|nr:hypothetical protein [Shinella sp. JR1-6]TAA54634.1 hypothetical protein EXZ48_26780 [Shinella sp. JR1-6]
MARVGFDAETGQLLRGWPHCLQSIKKILNTELGSMPQRRGAGSKIPQRIDDPQNPESVIALYLDTAQALEPRTVEGRQYGEPGFVLLQANIDAATPGHVLLTLGGIYFEDGHLGDYSNPSEKTVVIDLVDGEGVSSE